jgi:hypothetical protein
VISNSFLYSLAAIRNDIFRVGGDGLQGQQLRDSVRAQNGLSLSLLACIVFFFFKFIYYYYNSFSFCVYICKSIPSSKWTTNLRM